MTSDPVVGPPRSVASGTPEGAAEVPRGVYSGTLWQVLGRLAGSLGTFLALLVLARTLKDAEFGRFTFYLGLFGLLDAWTDFGTGAIAIRRTAGDPWALLPVLHSARRLRLKLAGIGFLATGLLIELYHERSGVFILLAALYPFTHALELSATVFKNRMDWRRPVAVRSLAALLRLVVVLALAACGAARAAYYLFATAAMSALANGVLHRISVPYLPKPTIPLRPATGLFREAWPLGLGMVCQQGYFYLDNLFIRAWLGDGPLGHYNAAMRLLSAAIILALYAASSALPWLAERARAGKLPQAAAALAQPLFLIGCLATGLCAPWSARLLGLCFGPEFQEAGPALAWLFAAIAAIHAGAVLLNALVAAGLSQRVLWVSLGALALNAALNWQLVPRFGLEGAAAATFATEASVALGAALALGGNAAVLRIRPWFWIAGPVAFGLAAAASKWLLLALEGVT